MGAYFNKRSGYFASHFVRSSGNFPMLCTYLMGLPAIGYSPLEMVMAIFMHSRSRVNPAGDHWAEFGPRDQCKSCAGRNSAGFGMTL